MNPQHLVSKTSASANWTTRALMVFREGFEPPTFAFVARCSHPVELPKRISEALSVKCNSDMLHQHVSCRHTSNHKAYKQNHHVLFAYYIPFVWSYLPESNRILKVLQTRALPSSPGNLNYPTVNWLLTRHAASFTSAAAQ